jgi:hypothetical protein
MTWTYANSTLDVTQAIGRLNAVRLLVGDTDSSDQQMEDEEIYFSLSQASDNIYNAASFVCKLLAAKYSRLVTTMADRGVSINYSDRITHYTNLATQIDALAKKVSGKTLGIMIGGVLVTDVYIADTDTSRVAPEFVVDQFDNPNIDLTTSYYPIGV